MDLRLWYASIPCRLANASHLRNGRERGHGDALHAAAAVLLVQHVLQIQAALKGEVNR